MDSRLRGNDNLDFHPGINAWANENKCLSYNGVGEWESVRELG